MKTVRLMIYIFSASVLLVACDPDNSSGPDSNHFKMTVDGTEVSADPGYLTFFVTLQDSAVGIYAPGGTVDYASIELDHAYATGTYPIITGNQTGGAGGMKFHHTDSIYYINETHGNGTLVMEIFDVEPGTIHELKGTFSGTAATVSGLSVTITNGSYYYHQP